MLERRHSDVRVDRVEDDRGGARGGRENAKTPMDASARESARGNRGVPRGDDEGDARARRRTNEPRGDSSASEGWARARGRAEEREGVQTLAMKYEDRPLMDPRGGEARLVKRERRRFHEIGRASCRERV